MVSIIKNFYTFTSLFSALFLHDPLNMKILPVPLIREADSCTILTEPIAGIDLMERAASACFSWLRDHIPAGRNIKIFCGAGNNGGDGLAIARMLQGAGFSVNAFVLSPPEKMSESCRMNLERMQAVQTMQTMHAMQGCSLLTDSGELPFIEVADVVVDAIFGSGLSRPAEGLVAHAMRHINSSGAMVVSIDVPSGLFCDDTTPVTTSGVVIRADYTLTFAPPKLAFFFPENDRYVGDWQLLDIGLSRDFIDSASVENFMLEAPDVSTILKTRNKFSHKGMYGHALLIAGSTGKMGAAVLAGRACMKSGAGLVTVRVPQSGVSIVQTAVPEAMVSMDRGMDHFSETPELSAYSSIAIGPGIGVSPQTATALKILIQHATGPIIFDADAINIISENRTWLGFLPKESIFTPHPKEFERLAGKSSNHFERNRMQRDFAIKYQCYVVLKGAHTAITTPDGLCYFNTTGNPGMATGGSGDVLTGIIAGLMAQGYSSLESCLLGVYIHGLAGNNALNEQGFEALTASDIIIELGKSFQSLYGKF